ncbi:acyl-CoA dehydrogenase [candidate division KSB1 bacterium 4572_119]|nr:MAG: acyl-CoA dehydrogenase [candidate division KSB1 bacterium 4572_119]
MDYFLTEDQQELRQLARKVAKEKVYPVAAHYDQTGEFPWDMVKLFAELDFFRLFIDFDHGGMGGGVTELSLITEELSRACGGIALAVAGTALGAFPIILFGSEEQKQKFLPKIADGEHLAGFCLTEPSAGSDAGAVKTRAERKGDKYILNGKKHFITNGGVAQIYTVIALTNPAKGSRGASAFVVPADAPGLSIGKKEDKMGIRASATSEVIFEDCEIPADYLLGREGGGFAVAMKTLDRTRPGVAAQALGIAQGALDAAVAYAKEREQFGQSVISFQAIQVMLADMATQIEAARALIYSTAKMIDSGSKNFSKESAMCKVYASDVAMKVTTDAVQIFGGYGYMKDYPAEKYMRDAKITQIYEGTNQIQRNVIAQKLIREIAK